MGLHERHRQYSQPLKQTTLGIISRGDSLVLAMKKRGFGAGKWNFAGGKNEPGESGQECVIREVEQEFGTKIKPPKLVAILYFYFVDVPPEKDWDQKCSVFEIDHWQGEPAESEEMAPRWWLKSDIPYDQMWPADRDWLEPVLAGNVVTGYFLFNSEQQCLETEIVLGRLVDE